MSLLEASLRAEPSLRPPGGKNQKRRAFPLRKVPLNPYQPTAAAAKAALYVAKMLGPAPSVSNCSPSDWDGRKVAAVLPPQDNNQGAQRHTDREHGDKTVF